MAPKDDTTIMYKLAGVYEALDDPKTAAHYHTEYIAASERLGRGVAEYARSCIFAARYHVNQGYLPDVDIAIGLLQKVANSNAEENANAKDSLAKLEGARRAMLMDMQ